MDSVAGKRESKEQAQRGTAGTHKSGSTAALTGYRTGDRTSTGALAEEQEECMVMDSTTAAGAASTVAAEVAPTAMAFIAETTTAAATMDTLATTDTVTEDRVMKTGEQSKETASATTRTETEEVSTSTVALTATSTATAITLAVAVAAAAAAAMDTKEIETAE